MEEINSKIFLDNMENAVIAINVKGEIVYCNKMAECILQTTLENILHKNVTAIMPEVGKKLQESLKSRRISLDILRKGKEDLIFKVSPIKNNGEIIGAMSLFQKVSEVEKIIDGIDAYKRIVRMLDIIIEFPFDGLWITDGKGKVLRINKASEKINEVKASDVIGKNVKDLEKEGLFDKSVTLEVLRRKDSATIVQHIKGKSILSSGNIVFDDKGNIELVVSNERDITHLNKVREELKETQALAKRYQSELSKAQLKDLEKENIIFESKAMEKVVDAALTVCKVDSCVLLLGESGVGKSLIAKLIHKYSSRNGQSFISINCGAIPESLIESELFGYEEGAFTGASKGGKAGIFEIADKGTLFLDEIDTLPLHLQVKLLRFLEDTEILRVGGVKYKKIDTRMIVATNQDLEDLVKKGKFRKDLFFRLSVVPIYIPPLRKRIDDISPLVKFFLDKYNKKYKKEKFISPLVINSLCEYSFPGNVRELSNIIERMVVMTKSKEIKLENLPQVATKTIEVSPPFLGEEGLPLKEALQRVESFVIKKTMERYRTQEKVAKILRVSQSTIARKIKKYKSNNA